MQKSIKLMLIEDHQMLRQGLISLLKEFDFYTIYEAENGKQALELLKEVQADVILLDIDMPVMNGLDTLKIIKQKYPITKVIVLTGYNSFAAEVLKLGADIYLPKNCSIDNLVSAINTLDKNLKDLYPNTNKVHFIRSNASRDFLVSQRRLTDKEVEVLKLFCQGKTRKETAHLFNVSSRTIRFHLDNIHKKTNTSNKADLILYAVRNGYISV